MQPIDPRTTDDLVQRRERIDRARTLFAGLTLREIGAAVSENESTVHQNLGQALLGHRDPATTSWSSGSVASRSMPRRSPTTQQWPE